MTSQIPTQSSGYSGTFSNFDSTLMQKVQNEAIDEDIGQHSWVTAKELREFISILNINESISLLDFGCGPGGPSTFIASNTGCKIEGIDLSSEAIDSAQNRTERMGLNSQIRFHIANANDPLQFPDCSFDRAISIDVVLHLSEREKAFREIFRTLKPRGQFLFTDAGILVGPISNQQIQIRSPNGHSQFVPEGY